MATSKQQQIVIIGSGVIGLTNALTLSNKYHQHDILVLAAHMPGDYDINYASPWAGANYDTYSKRGSHSNELERLTWPHLKKLAEQSPEAAIHFQDTKCVLRSKDRGSDHYRDYQDSGKNHPWLRHWKLKRDEVPEGVDEVICFQSVCINTPLYLPWLVGQCLRNKVRFQRAVLQDLSDVKNLVQDGAIDVVVNCTGLGSKTLGGVEDNKMFPVRGQIVLVREESDAMYSVSGTDGPVGDREYSMLRTAGGGTVLGGCYQVGSWEAEVDVELAERIKARAVATCPMLVKAKVAERPAELSVIRHGVGLRPARKGGPRIERDTVQGLEVVHCYGHGGCGYQQSYGSAEEVAVLIESILTTDASL